MRATYHRIAARSSLESSSSGAYPRSKYASFTLVVLEIMLENLHFFCADASTKWHTVLNVLHVCTAAGVRRPNFLLQRENVYIFS